MARNLLNFVEDRADTAHGLYCADEQRAGGFSDRVLPKQREQREILSLQVPRRGLNLNSARYKRG